MGWISTEAMRLIAAGAWDGGLEMMEFLAVTCTDICHEIAGREGCYR